MQPIIQNNKEKIIELCKKHFVKTFYVFGSAATGNFSEHSNIDFLYKIDIDNFLGWDTGAYDYTDNLLSLEKELTQLFNRKIDLVPDIIIPNKYFRMSINKSKQMIYAA